MITPAVRYRPFAALALLCGLTACGGERAGRYAGGFDGPVQCATYARAHSAIALHGAAASWWWQARGRYARTHTPRAGEVLVFRATARLPGGHVSIVRRRLSARTILVDQANWEPGRIDRGVPVTDFSPDNDWTAVRVWWAPIHALGRRIYPAYGFISGYDANDAS